MLSLYVSFFIFSCPSCVSCCFLEWEIEWRLGLVESVILSDNALLHHATQGIISGIDADYFPGKQNEMRRHLHVALGMLHGRRVVELRPQVQPDGGGVEQVYHVVHVLSGRAGGHRVGGLRFLSFFFLFCWCWVFLFGKARIFGIGVGVRRWGMFLGGRSRR